MPATSVVLESARRPAQEQAVKLTQDDDTSLDLLARARCLLALNLRGMA